jgi:two-component sensor histidine kinase
VRVELLGTGDIDPDTTTSLGMHLVAMLVEQLEGRLEVVRRNGTRFGITFPLADDTIPPQTGGPASLS